MTPKKLLTKIKTELSVIYGEREAGNIAALSLEMKYQILYLA